MKSTWTIAFKELLQSEGGFTDDVRDPGNYLSDGRPGCTNLGVTQAAWEVFIGHKVTHEDMKALTPETVEPFYKKKYWDCIAGDSLPLGVDYMVFDMAVNSGPAKAARTLQACVKANQDGHIGPATLASVSDADLEKLIEEYSESRLNFMRGLTGWPIYGKGWERRVNEVADLAEKLTQA